MRSDKIMGRVTWARCLRGLGFGLTVTLTVGQALAQSDEATSEAPAAPAGQMVETAPPTTTTSTSYVPGFLPAPGTNMDAHLPSSAQSKTDINQPDTFDLGRRGGGGETLRGNADSLGILGNESAAGLGDPGKGLHVVKKGDTLWGITGEALDDSRMWPKVWSFNPQLQNPHWIYPGDQLRLRASGALADGTRGGGIRGGTLGSGVVGRTSLVPPDTVFLRDLGYIDDPDKEVWGEIVGAREEQQLLADGNHVYMFLRPGADVQLGQLMTVFQEVRDPPNTPGARRPPGQIIAFKGTVKIDTWDPKKRVARGELIESLDIIERGAKVGPVGRRYYVVPPASSQVDLRARVLTSMYPHELLGRDQVLFIDRGTNDGLKAGNRLFVVRQGDAWRDTLLTTTSMARARILMDVPERVEVETPPLHGDDEDFPEEVVGELRIIRAHRYSSLALVIESSEEIEPGDQAVVRKGF